MDDKYQYSCNNKDIQVHGWISSDPAVGFWQITPSDEFRSGGPLKQSLTSHVGPTTLAVSDTLGKGCSFKGPHDVNKHMPWQFSLSLSLSIEWRHQIFLSAHYAGKDLVPKFGPGEPWKKVFGPVFIYLNSASAGDDPRWLWEDAKIQVCTEMSGVL